MCLCVYEGCVMYLVLCCQARSARQILINVWWGTQCDEKRNMKKKRKEKEQMLVHGEKKKGKGLMS